MPSPTTDDQIAHMALFSTIRSLQRYCPSAVAFDINGVVTLDGKMVISKLFDVSRADVDSWFKRATHVFQWAFPNPETKWEPTSAMEAAQAFASSLASTGSPYASALSKLKFYVLSHHEGRIYFVMVGLLSHPPQGATVGTLLL